MKKFTFYKKVKIGIVALLFSIPFLGNAQTNIAPNATVTAAGNGTPGCQSGACSLLNDLNFGTCGTQQVWISTSPPNAVGQDYIEWNFPFPETFDSLIIHNGYNDKRTVTGGVVQYWDGSAWVNHYTFNNLPNLCVYRLGIGKLTTDRFRITSFLMQGIGQASNPSFREIEILQAPNGVNDAAVIGIDTPGVFCAGTQNVVARIANLGINRIDSVMVGWSLDGVFQANVNYVGLLDTVTGTFPYFAQVNLGTAAFVSGVPREIKVWTFLPNGTLDTVPVNDTLTAMKSASIAGGAYTINSTAPASSTNFIDFASFFALVNQYGICSSVTLDVVSGSGPYVEQVSIPNFNGSASRTLTINGNGETIDYTATSAADQVTLSIENSSYVIIDSLNVTASGATNGIALYMNNIDNVSILNSSFIVDTTATSFSGPTSVRITGSQTSASTATIITNLLFEGNTVKGGYYAFSIAGASSSSVIRNNKISAFYLYATYLYNNDGLLFELNDISRPFRTTVTTGYGIYSSLNSNLTVNRNRIHDMFGGSLTSTSTTYPIYGNNDATLGNENVFMNNLIYNIQHNGTVYGIYDIGSDYTKYYNNTVVLDYAASTGGITRGIYNSSSATDLEFQNNVVYITRGGSGTKHGIYLNGGVSSDSTSNHNDVYVNSAGSGSQYYGYIGSDQATLADFQAAGGGSNSLDVDPTFTNATLNDFQPNNVSLNAAGFPAPQVVEDFNGAPRVVSANDIGSFNINSPALDVAANKVLINTPFCAGLEDVSVVISNNGIARVDSLMINWSIDGVVQTPINYQTLLDTIGSTAGNIDTVLLTSYNFASGVGVDFVAWVSAPNGITPDSFSPNDTADAYAGGALVGTYTVNPNIAASATNYLDIATLSTNLSTFGICGAVNVTVSAGNYFENIALSNVAGSGPSSPIVIDGVDSSLTILTYDATGTGMGVVSIDKTDNVTVKNFGLYNTGASNAAGVVVANSSNVTVSNCYIEVDTVSTSSSIIGLLLSSSISSNSSGYTGRNVTFEDNTVNGGYYGFRASGLSTDAIEYLRLIHNDFIQPYYYGVYAYYCDSLELIGNKVNTLKRGNTFSYGLYSYYSQNTVINENEVISGYYGIYYYIFTYNWPITRKSEFVNNMIYSDNSYGMYIYYADSIDVFHNTIVSNSTTTPALQMYSSANKSEDYDVRNNIFYSNGSEAVRTNVADTIMFTTFDYNNFYTTGSNLLSINSTSYSNLAGYVSAQPAFNANSIEGDPQFFNVSSTPNLHILGALVNGQGDNTVGVLTDIDGDTRPLTGSTIVDMGADEYNPPSCPPPTAVTFTNVGITTADIIITGATGSTWSYEYGPFGFTSGTSTGVLGTATTAVSTISGLTSGTTYQVYIREICSVTDSSPQVGPYSFGTAYSIPLNEDFESFTAGQVGPSYTNGWTSTGTGSSWGWESETGTGVNVNSSSTGPLWDRTNFGVSSGIYMYMETSGGTVGDTAVLSSPPIYVDSSKTALILEYSFFNYGTNIDRMDVLVDTNGVTNLIASFVGAQQTAATDSWVDTSAVLIGYQGKSVKILFRGVNVACCTGDIAIDEIHLYDTVAVDYAVDAIISPVSDCGLSAADSVTIAIKNTGLSPVTNFPATYVFNGGTPIVQTVTAVINPGTTYNFTFDSTVNVAATQSYTMTASIAVPGDGNAANDSKSSNISSSFSDVIDSTGSPTKFYDFEANDGNLITYADTLTSSWAWGVPNTFYINGASSGTKAWSTNLTGNHNANEMSYLETSCYDLSTIAATEQLFISFKAIYKTEVGADQVWMEYTTDNGNTWSKVLPSASSANFYSNTTANVWEGFSNGGVGVWIPVINDVLGLGGNSKVKFRFAFISNGSVENEGFGVDDLQINLAVSDGDDLFNGDALLSIQPNPSNGQFNVVFTNYAKGIYKIEVMNVNGQLVNAENVAVASKFQSKSMNLDNLDKGVYFVKVTNGSSVTTQKLVIK